MKTIKTVVITCLVASAVGLALALTDQTGPTFLLCVWLGVAPLYPLVLLLDGDAPGWVFGVTVGTLFVMLLVPLCIVAHGAFSFAAGAV